jgi:Glycosyl transferase 4-like
MPSARQPRSCVIVVENLPVPFDRRVWQEAQALHRAGWTVSVICPTNDHFPKPFEVIDDIAIYRHPLPAEGRGALAYFHNIQPRCSMNSASCSRCTANAAFRSSSPAIRPT